MTDNSLFPSESAGGLMATNIPTARVEETISDILSRLAKESFEDIHLIFIVDEQNHLTGVMNLSKALVTNSSSTIKEFSEPVKVSVHPNTDQEKVVIAAVENDLRSVPVVNEENKLLGAVTADKIIDVLHMEHLEDFLRSTGIRGRGSRILELVNANLLELVKSRIPWLVVGLMIAFLISITTSTFENSLRENISLVFFLPVVTYIAAAVGAQTETIFIRAITILKIKTREYLLREILVGASLGVILGLITGMFAVILSGQLIIGITVMLSLILTISIASVLACLVPITLRLFKKDPALGGGPFTTAIQDLISVSVYLVVATLLL